MANSADCCNQLCTMWKCSLTSRNLLGHMPKQMAERYPDIIETIEDCQYRVEMKAQRLIEKIDSEKAANEKKSLISKLKPSKSNEIKNQQDLENRLARTETSLSLE